VRDVRPSSSKVRGAVFDRLQREIEGARVLDLCAGSGALAIEALSRGAEHAALVELNPAMVAYLRAQLAELRLEDRSLVWPGDAARILAGGRPSGIAPFDLVLFDPPYADAALYERVLAALAAGDWLAPHAVVVVEWSPEVRRAAVRRGPARGAVTRATPSPSKTRSGPTDLQDASAAGASAKHAGPDWGAGWVLDARREHGSTVLDFLHRADLTTARRSNPIGEMP
jgi:16S rRNA (guanine966-N2)-methyltransferase